MLGERADRAAGVVRDGTGTTHTGRSHDRRQRRQHGDDGVGDLGADRAVTGAEGGEGVGPRRVVGERQRPADGATGDLALASGDPGRPQLARFELDVERPQVLQGRRHRRRVPARSRGTGSSPVHTEHRPHGAGLGIVEGLLEELHQASIARRIVTHQVGLGVSRTRRSARHFAAS